MVKSFKNIAVLTSGGDAPGMNAALRSVVRTCAHYHINCFGVYRGYQGLIEGDIKPLSARSVNNIINKGGTKLKSARSQEFRTKEGRKKAFDNLQKHAIEALAKQEDVIKILELPKNHTVVPIASGCCGMAGAFGYAKEHHAVSMQIGEEVLFPHIRQMPPESVLVANGTSCRHQVHDGTQTEGIHPVEVLYDALPQLSISSQL
jgi:Fe-S oxidoreductase